MKVFFISNGRYTDCLSLTYATNECKKLKLHYKYYIKRETTHQNERTFKVNIKVLMIRSSHKDSSREGTNFISECPCI